MQPSKYQQAIFDFAEKSEGNLMVNAVAGAGKSTTAMDIAKILELYGTRMTAFNRHIRDALVVKAKEKKISCCEIATFNSFGNSVLNQQLKFRPRLNENKDRNILLYKITKDQPKAFTWCNTIVRLISLFKFMNLSILQAEQQLDDISDRFDLEIPEDPLFKEWLFKTYTASVNEHSIISFNDQVFLPVYLGLEIPQTEVLIVDETHDACAIEFELIHRGCKRGRIFCFGDPQQAIYSFKGSQPNAMTHFKDRLNATELPLSICYRCSKEVVREAQKIVPRIEYAEWAPEGIVEDIKPSVFFKQATQGDMILCRVTVDLVTSCLRFIRDGRRAFVQGREIGKSLEYIIEKCATDGDDISEFIKRLNVYHSEESGRLKAVNAESRLINLDDRCDTIKAIAGASDSVTHLRQQIDTIFSGSETDGIQHLTIHKCKGLECSGNVYLLSPEKIPHPRAKKAEQLEEERRLLYVAITRAKKNFYYVRNN